MFDLTPYNTFGLQVSSTAGYVISSKSDLRHITDADVLILGQGSDILLTEDIEGMVLIDNIKFCEISDEDDCYVVKVGGGNILDELIAKLVDLGISGLENLSAIPGTMGAAPVQNIGAYGVEIGKYIEDVECFNLISREVEHFSHEQCQFGYRTSYFKEHKEHKLFIMEVTLKLPKGFHPVLSYQGIREQEFASPKALRSKVVELRKQKLPDPKEIGNAGSFFKNPTVDAQTYQKLKARFPDLPAYPNAEGSYKLAAGWLIDRAGCRGITHGKAGTWEQQALVLVNRGGAKPHEIVALARYVRAEVQHMFDLALEPEVRIFGSHGEISWEQL
ncbi:MAG: UDP-N-acetylmuramate dehydrogenase [Succinivibrio sp.]|nr:UDP-N-acetylmuramate dehydrogenase [Succinivibrio sp.]